MSAISLQPAAQGPQPPKWPANIKCVILNPIYPLVDCRWALALPRILQGCPPGSIMLSDWRYGIGSSRESLTYSAMTGVPDCTHLLFLDADTLPDDGAIFRLFQDLEENPNIQIISGIYFNSLLTGLAAWKDEQALRLQDLVGRENPLIETQKTGMGLCLIRASLFRMLEEKNEEVPYFYYKLDARAKPAAMLSEDFYWMKKLEKYGIHPWVDLRARCLHLKTVAIAPEGSVSGPMPQCGPNQHWDAVMNKCVDNQPQSASAANTGV